MTARRMKALSSILIVGVLSYAAGTGWLHIGDPKARALDITSEVDTSELPPRKVIEDVSVQPAAAIERAIPLSMAVVAQATPTKANVQKVEAVFTNGKVPIQRNGKPGSSGTANPLAKAPDHVMVTVGITDPKIKLSRIDPTNGAQLAGADPTNGDGKDLGTTKEFEFSVKDTGIYYILNASDGAFIESFKLTSTDTIQFDSINLVQTLTAKLVNSYKSGQIPADVDLLTGEKIAVEVTNAKLSGSSSNSGKIAVQIGDWPPSDAADISTTASAGPKLANPKPLQSPMSVILKGMSGWVPYETHLFTLHPPSASLKIPVISKYSNNKFESNWNPIAGSMIATYGGYLRLYGLFSTSQTRLLAFKKDPATGQFNAFDLNSPLVSILDNDGTWTAELNVLPKGDMGAGEIRLIAVVNNTSEHAVSDLISIENKKFAFDKNIIPTVVSVGRQGGGNATATGGFYPFNSLDLQVEGKFSEGANPEGAALLLLDEAGAVVTAAATPTGSNTAVVPFKTAEGKRMTYKIAFSVGDVQGKPSAPFSVLVRTSSFKLIGHEPPDFGVAPGQKKLTLKFDPEHPLDPTRAVLKANYRIRASDGSGQFSQATASGVPPDGADYVAAGNSVVLTFNSLTADIYELEIVGGDDSVGLKDIFGNRLEGDNGPGTSLRVVVTEVDKLKKNMNGDFVVFKEYTPPREVPPGFNPSDRVETRVARLYYFRDANRVAQIINRNLRAHNGVAVSVAQRVAQESRDNANRLTDERRSQQRDAIESARLTRDSEHRLADAQAQLAQAQANEDRARSDAAVAKSDDLQSQNVSTEEIDEQKKLLQSRIDLTNEQLSRTDVSDEKKEDLRMQRADLEDQLEDKNRLAFTATNKIASQLANDRLTAASQQVSDLQAKVNQLVTEVANRRANEVQANEQALKTESLEDRARETSFLKDVAAARTDPDNFAPGVPDSPDPVEQVSISVIGEAVIQLRGPLKGMNVIRTMINQIDAPVGQVRVGIHTVQINGERGKRMEKVAAEIQDYIDHSRFLTSQSAQMLRKAVVTIASQLAEEASMECTGRSQADRDKKYLYRFFGRDFVDELHALDSEFLASGNKLLSLHSMDTTSLASALFLVALASNDTRERILDEFRRAIEQDLPNSEDRYFEEGGPRRNCKKYQLLACNARFESLFGVLGYPVQSPETMTPIQREFIRLAQIFKSRLVTELELKQRVMERALIEDRGNINGPIAEQQMLKRAEEKAEDALNSASMLRNSQQQKLLSAINVIDASIREIEDMAGRCASYAEFLSRIHDLMATEKPIVSVVPPSPWDRKGPVEFELMPGRIEGQHDLIPVDLPRTKEIVDGINHDLANIVKSFELIRFDGIYAAEYRDLRRYVETVQKLTMGGTISADAQRLYVCIVKIVAHLAAHIQYELAPIQASATDLKVLLAASDFDIKEILKAYTALEKGIGKWYNPNDSDKQKIDAAREGLGKLIEAYQEVELAREELRRKRRPTDHKKLLDMLIDEVEDKYIDLLEGTRAHTANIDGYLKLVATALDDDFNTQFYYPSFRQIREASQYWDVQVGKVETTTVLVNNREFAKVTPEATMEFDLPKRDILIKEAMQGSLALVQEYGALVQDPNFLALVKMASGQPTSSLAPGSAEGLSLVRNVLPALPRASDTQFLTQDGPGTGGMQFGAALEGLIPDPAVYKFETGTGYEIRPVVQPDGQSVVFHFQYMYSTNIREPVRPDEKHLGRVKRHFIDTDVQLSNYELREISRYQVALKAARTSRGVPLLEDVPAVGILFRPLPSDESSLQENIILGQSTIFPTLFDLMGLRWAPAVVDLDPLKLINSEFIVRRRHQDLSNRVFDMSSSHVDESLQIPAAERRADLYRSQETIPYRHPDGYEGPGLNLRDGHMREPAKSPTERFPESRAIPGLNPEGLGPAPLEDAGTMIEESSLESTPEGLEFESEEVIQEQGTTPIPQDVSPKGDEKPPYLPSRDSDEVAVPKETVTMKPEQSSSSIHQPETRSVRSLKVTAPTSPGKSPTMRTMGPNLRQSPAKSQQREQGRDHTSTKQPKSATKPYASRLSGLSKREGSVPSSKRPKNVVENDTTKPRVPSSSFSPFGLRSN